MKRSPPPRRRAPLRRSSSPLRRTWIRRRARRRPEHLVDVAYRDWLRTQPCRVGLALGERCRGASDAEHPWTLGTGIKCDDRLCWSCCRRHHEDKGRCLGFFRGRSKEWRRAWLAEQGQIQRAEYLAGRGQL